MAIDPVCGMDIDPAGAEGDSAYKGETYYFCSPNCKKRFDADPEAVLSPKEERSEKSPPPERAEQSPCLSMA